METVKAVWELFQKEILGMGWLSRLINKCLTACGLDTAGRIGGSVKFLSLIHISEPTRP